jgi:hypothetical protein
MAHFSPKSVESSDFYLGVDPPSFVLSSPRRAIFNKFNGNANFTGFSYFPF